MHHHHEHEHGSDHIADHDAPGAPEFTYDISRRQLLRRGLRGGLTLGAVAAAVPFALGSAEEAEAQVAPGGRGAPPPASFFGEHQAGIVTPPPTRLEFVVLDLVTTERADVAALFQRWTEAARRLTTGGTTITFGVGPSFFDRLGLQASRPTALTSLPAFSTDALLNTYTGGDLALQVCATSAAAATAAAAELEALAAGVAAVRSTQLGSREATARRQTPRNLLGFKDGTVNPPFVDGLTADAVIWVGSEGPTWLQGGSYLVMRRIRLDLATWNATPVATQEAAIGRDRETGAPLTGDEERDRPDLRARDASGQLVIAADAHIRRARPNQNGGARILRRGYGFQDAEDDAGLLFLSYQRDPAQFTRIQASLAAADGLNRFATTVGSGIWAVLPGVTSGGWLGSALLGS
ncbi:MAG: Dyp-type peroxidase [Dehalococcoidia bacterium]